MSFRLAINRPESSVEVRVLPAVCNAAFAIAGERVRALRRSSHGSRCA